MCNQSSSELHERENSAKLVEGDEKEKTYKDIGLRFGFLDE